MRKTTLFGYEVRIRNKAEVELEKKLLLELSEEEKDREETLRKYYEERMFEAGERPESYLPNFSRGDFHRVRLLIERVMSDDVSSVARNLLYRKCVYAMAEEAIKRNCEYVVDVAKIYGMAMSSKATSGFVVGIGGTGFGVTSPDGVYAAQMGVSGTGLIRKKSGIAETNGYNV